MLSTGFEPDTCATQAVQSYAVLLEMLHSAKMEGLHAYW